MKVDFVITGFHAESRPEEEGHPIRHYMVGCPVVPAQKAGSLGGIR